MADDFHLDPPEVAQPSLLDEDPVTTRWPIPPVKQWKPNPKPSRMERLKAMLRRAWWTVIGRDDE